MSKKRLLFLIVLVVAAGAGVYAYRNMAPPALVLTGIVTTSDVIVSPQIAGQIGQLLVTEGDAVKKDQLLAVEMGVGLSTKSRVFTKYSIPQAEA